jgi:hypothetical protein
MPDLININVNENGVPERIGALPESVRKAIFAEETRIGEMLLGSMRAKAGGEVLKVRTGKYLQSFKAKVSETQTGVSLTVGTKSPLAHILEYGAQILPHLIRPKATRALHFLGTSGEVFAGIVHSPGASIAPHSVEHSTFLEEKDEVAEQLTQAVGAALEEESKFSHFLPGQG